MLPSYALGESSASFRRARRLEELTNTQYRHSVIHVYWDKICAVLLLRISAARKLNRIPTNANFTLMLLLANWPLQNGAKTMAQGYSSVTAPRELSDEYQHGRTSIFSQIFAFPVLWTKVSSALEGLICFWFLCLPLEPMVFGSVCPSLPRQCGGTVYHQGTVLLLERRSCGRTRPRPSISDPPPSAPNSVVHAHG